MAEVTEMSKVTGRHPRHPDRARLEKFGRGKLSRRQNRAIVRHLLAGCETCRAITWRLLPGLPGPGTEVDRPELDYGEAFAAAGRELSLREGALAAERSKAPGLFRELAAHPFDRQRRTVAADARFQTWAFCDLLLDASREWGFQEPARALELAHLGVTAASRLSAETYGEPRVNDLAARAWATLANAERIGSDFRAAEEGFAKAERLLKRGTGDPLEKARLLLLKASLIGDQRRFDEAFRLLDRVIAISRRSGDPHLTGKALIKQGIFCGVADRLETAIRCLAEGIELIDPTAEPRLLVAARHNLIVYLTQAGRHREAAVLLDETRPLYTQLGDRMNLIRLQWLEGKIAQALGDVGQAEALFQQVREELVQRELGYDAALLSLDLAGIYAQQGRGGEMRRLAEEMIPIFQSRDVHREATAALIVFQKAAEMERVTLGLVQELRDYLRQCRKTPGLRFRDPL
jgi:tetratricopeptide (TPR) repeat protein